jgi:glycopeptide antibiotics resistance protein
MYRFFHWFYCLPLFSAFILVALAAMLFLLLRSRLGAKPWWKAGIFLLFGCWLFVIYYGTLGFRTENGSSSEPVLIPFYSYYTALNGGSVELFRSNFMNIALFFPAGLLGCELMPKRWRPFCCVLLITGLFTLVSIGIEYIQFQFSMGLAETDDVIHNTLGTLLGGIFCRLSIKTPR